jgi:hypothetical protein
MPREMEIEECSGQEGDDVNCDKNVIDVSEQNVYDYMGLLVFGLCVELLIYILYM